MLRKFLHIVMALVLVVANLGLTISTHYCQGEAVESRINLTPEDLDCGMMVMTNSCDIPPVKKNTNKMRFDNIPCCENEYQQLQLTEDFVQDSNAITLNVDFAIAIVYATLNLDLFPNSTQQLYTEYHFPPFEKDIQVFFQTFLI